MRYQSFLFFLIFLSFYTNPLYSLEFSSEVRRIQKLVSDGSVILKTPEGKSLVAINTDAMLTPASIIKIPTSYCLLEKLGADYRFKTDVLINTQNDLLVRSWGDPFFVSEEIRLLARELKEKQNIHFRSLQFDTTAFEQVTIPGVNQSLNPYDALNGALVVNFNTMFLTRDSKGKLQSAEEQTPLTPLAYEKGVYIPNGKKERINFAGSEKESLRYAKELIKTIFQEEGISFPEKPESGVVNNDWKLYFQFQSSRNLSFLLKGMLKYSNNFTANQLIMHAGGLEFGFPTNLQKGKRFLDECVKNKLKLNDDEVYIEEGSGISRNNLITANSFMTALKAFEKYRNLLAGKYGVLIKSGTLTGVYNYTGFIPVKDQFYPFVIITEQKQNNRYRILKLLKKIAKKNG